MKEEPKVLYLVSEQGFSGLHTICLGITLRLRRQGYRLGYMKPLGNRYRKEGDLLTDDDAYETRRELGLEEELKDICPVIFTAQLVREALSEGRPDYLSSVRRAFSRVSEGKDIVILQGPLAAAQGAFLGISTYRLAREFAARVVMVEKYDDAFFVDHLLCARDAFGDRLEGVIYNMVPPVRYSFVNETLKPYLEETEGIPVFGVIPEDRPMKAVSARELAEGLRGEVLAGEDALENQVEGVLVGAMGPEHAISIFRKRKGQCVVTGGDRSDIQLAALEVGMPCLILSGSLYPSSIILGKADELKIPVILVPDDTLGAAEKVDLILKTSRTRDPRKLARIEELLDMYLDWERLLRMTGLPPRS